MLLFSLWKHLPYSGFSKLYLYATITMYWLFSSFYYIVTFYRNGHFKHKWPRASIKKSSNILELNIQLSKAIPIKPGQYIGLWMPTVSLTSFLQVHPFTVTSWSEGDVTSIDLIVDAAQGLTRQLSLKATNSGSKYKVGIFGPFGPTIRPEEYSVILMIATDMGLAAHLSLLRQLVWSNQTHRTRTHRVRLVWSVERMDLLPVFTSILNQLLEDDKGKRETVSDWQLQVSLADTIDSNH